MSILRLGLAASLLVAFAGCSGSGGVGNILGPITGPGGPTSFSCDPGTQVQLANPQSYQSGVSPNIGQIVIVANGNNNNLYTSYGQWNVTLSDQFGNSVYGGNLQPYSYPSGPHPYGSDFYYSSSIGQLPQGDTWNVSLSEPGNSCYPLQIGTFST